MGFGNIVPPLFYKMMEEGGEGILEEWRIKEKADKLRVFHYSGKADPLIVFDRLDVMQKESF